MNKITIVVPVYGRAELLRPALDSVLNQSGRDWTLVIADDCSDNETQSLIQKWTERNKHVPTEWIKREKNLGLFKNLNESIRAISTEWVLLLCSDDLLMPQATKIIHAIIEDYPESRLILSTFESINENGSVRPPDSSEHHDKVSRYTAVIPSEVFVPSLLEHGSLNGNLTGMAFRKDLWLETRGFREDWRHAADWEWLLKAGTISDVVLNREMIARVRTHKKQLSNKNRYSGHELIEVSEVVRILLEHKLVSRCEQRFRWAARIMQHHMWNGFKFAARGRLAPLIEAVRLSHKTAGVPRTVMALVAYVPERVRRYFSSEEAAYTREVD